MGKGAIWRNVLKRNMGEGAMWRNGFKRNMGKGPLWRNGLKKENGSIVEEWFKKGTWEREHCGGVG